MAIIQCPECEKSVSDQATACPHCGFPLEDQKFYRIWLTSANVENRELVQLIQGIRNIDYPAAEKLVGEVPFTLINNLSEEVAKRYCNQIIEFGGIAEVIEQGENSSFNKKYHSLKMITGSQENRNLVQLIAEVRGIDFVSARELLNTAPFVLANNLGIEVAKNYCDRIINMGGIAEIIEQSDYDASTDLSIKATANKVYTNTNTNTQNSGTSFWQIVLAVVVAIIIISFE